MKSTGVVRKIDELGRIVIPIEVRRVLGIEEKDSVEIFVEDGKVILKKYDEVCTLCGENGEFNKFKNKNLCSHCIDEIKVKNQ